MQEGQDNTPADDPGAGTSGGGAAGDTSHLPQTPPVSYQDKGDEGQMMTDREEQQMRDRERAFRESIPPQTLTLQVERWANNLGLIVQNSFDGYQRVERLDANRIIELQLSPGDRVSVVVLAGEDLEQFNYAQSELGHPDAE